MLAVFYQCSGFNKDLFLNTVLLPASLLSIVAGTWAMDRKQAEEEDRRRRAEAISGRAPDGGAKGAGAGAQTARRRPKKKKKTRQA